MDHLLPEAVVPLRRLPRRRPSPPLLLPIITPPGARRRSLPTSVRTSFPCSPASPATIFPQALHRRLRFSPSLTTLCHLHPPPRPPAIFSMDHSPYLCPAIIGAASRVVPSPSPSPIILHRPPPPAAVGRHYHAVLIDSSSQPCCLLPLLSGEPPLFPPAGSSSSVHRPAPIHFAPISWTLHSPSSFSTGHLPFSPCPCQTPPRAISHHLPITSSLHLSLFTTRKLQIHLRLATTQAL